MQVTTSDLNEVRGLASGRTVFVACPGPSLRHVPDGALDDAFVIAVNAGVLKFPRARWYCSSDGRVTHKGHFAAVAAGEMQLALSIDGFGGFNREVSRIGITEARVLWFRKKRSILMRRGDSKLIFGKSSAHCATHLAIVMGAARVVLLGCDCAREDGKGYFFEFNGDMDGYRPGPIINSDNAGLEEARGHWRELARANPEAPIVSVGPGPGFPEIDLEEVLDGHVVD